MSNGFFTTFASSPSSPAMEWWVSTPPVDPVIDTGEAILFLRLEDEVSGLNDCIDAATDYAQDMMNIALAEQTITARYYDGSGDRIDLPRGPLLAVVSITDDNAAVITDFNVRHAGHTSTLVINVPFRAPLTVVYRAGHERTNAIRWPVPAAIRQAILTHVGTLMENRESASDRTKTVVPHSLEDFYRLKRRAPVVG